MCIVHAFLARPIHVTVVTHFEMKSIIIFIIILISNNVKGQSGKLSRFYDFEIEIDFKHGLFEDDYKIIFPNGLSYEKFKQNSLYKIKYSYDQNQIRIPIDTLIVDLCKAEMDKIFILTLNQFSIEYEENLSQYKIPPPPPLNDGMIVSISLDLNFRGDFYEKWIRDPFVNKKFKELYDFVENIFETK